ncbi:MAG: ATP-binding protein [Rhodobacteraceae bacterium]|nr:ATP-binding protein [Paracoccaceae bacterium]
MLTISLSVGVVWIISALIAETVIRENLDKMFDSALEETAQRILPLAVQELFEAEDDGTSQMISTLREHDEFLTYVVRDRSGRILLQSHDSRDQEFPPFEQTGFITTEKYILYYDAALGGDYTITIAEPLKHRAEAARETLLALGLPLVLLLPLTIGAIWILLHFMLGSLRGFRDELAARDGQDLAPVATGKLPTEILPVAEAVNALLERLQSTLVAERSFATNAAHELRTPVAAALAQTQRLQAEATDENTVQRANNIESALKRLNRMSEKLMQMARAEGASLRVDIPHDLTKVLQMVVNDLAYSDTGNQIELTLPQGPVLSRIDPDAFAIAARNLLENALRHGRSDTPVNVTLHKDGTLTVVNASPVVPPEDLKKLTHRFARQDRNTDGSGLGLSIVQVIAEGAGGKLELRSPARHRADGFEAVFSPAKG